MREAEPKTEPSAHERRAGETIVTEKHLQVIREAADQKVLKMLRERKNTGTTGHLQSWCSVSELMIETRMGMSQTLESLKRIFALYEMEFIAGQGTVNNRYRITGQLKASGSSSNANSSGNGSVTPKTGATIGQPKASASKRAAIAFSDAVYVGAQAAAKLLKDAVGSGLSKVKRATR